MMQECSTKSEEDWTASEQGVQNILPKSKKYLITLKYILLNQPILVTPL
jgi:hypothetical protein